MVLLSAGNHAATKRRPIMTYWNIDSVNGNSLSEGIQSERSRSLHHVALCGRSDARGRARIRSHRPRRHAAGPGRLRDSLNSRPRNPPRRFRAAGLAALKEVERTNGHYHKRQVGQPVQVCTRKALHQASVKHHLGTHRLTPAPCSSPSPVASSDGRQCPRRRYPR